MLLLSACRQTNVCASIMSSDKNEAVEDGRRGRPCHSCLCASEMRGSQRWWWWGLSIKHFVVTPESAQRSRAPHRLNRLAASPGEGQSAVGANIGMSLRAERGGFEVGGGAQHVFVWPLFSQAPPDKEGRLLSGLLGTCAPEAARTQMSWADLSLGKSCIFTQLQHGREHGLVPFALQGCVLVCFV